MLLHRQGFFLGGGWYRFGLIWHQLFNIPLHAARRAMAAAASRSPLASKETTTLFLRYTPFLPRTSLRSHSGGLTASPSPQNRKKANIRKEKTTSSPPDTKTRDEKKKDKGLLLPLCSSPPISSISTSGPSCSSPSWAAVASASGALSLHSLRGGDGDLHPLAACWAIFLAVQASALAP